jgi:hypothetical protein
MLQTSEDDAIWQMSGYEELRESPRENGRRLLFAQIRVIMPDAAMRDGEQQEVIINMLAQRYTGFAVVGGLERPGWEATGKISGAALAYRETGQQVEEIKFF